MYDIYHLTFYSSGEWCVVTKHSSEKAGLTYNELQQTIKELKSLIDDKASSN